MDKAHIRILIERMKRELEGRADHYTFVERLEMLLEELEQELALA